MTYKSARVWDIHFMIQYFNPPSPSHSAIEPWKRLLVEDYHWIRILGNAFSLVNYYDSDDPNLLY